MTAEPLRDAKTGTEVHDTIEHIIHHASGHFRVLGPPGSGKASLLLRRYEALSGGGTAHEGVIILTYSRDSLKRTTESVLPPRSGRLGSPPVFTYSTLAREVISSTGRTPPRIIEGVEEQLLLERVIEERVGRMRSDYRSIHRCEGFRRRILDVLHLLLQNGIIGEAKKQLLASVSGPPRLHDILMLFDGYVEGLRELGLATFYDVAWEAAKLCRGNTEVPLRRRARAILVQDFQDIDPGQFELITAFAPPSGEIAVNVFGDPCGPYFGFRGTRERFLMSEFPRLYGGTTFHLPARCIRPNVLGAVAETLLKDVVGKQADAFLPVERVEKSGRGGAAEGSGDGQQRSQGRRITLEICESEYAEVYAVAGRAHRLISLHGYGPDDIAVVANDKSRYEALLQTAFGQWGVPLNTGRSEGGIHRNFIHSLLRLIVSPADELAGRSVLTSPLYSSMRAECMGAHGVVDGTALESQELRGFVEALRKDIQKGKPDRSLDVIVNRCLLPTFTAHAKAGGDDRGYGLISRLLESWESFTRALIMVGRHADLGLFLRSGGFFETEMATPRPSPEEVGFYSCREINGISLKVVMLLGCSELVFPSVQKREGIVPEGVLQEILDREMPEKHVSVYGARSSKDHLREEHALMYLSLTRAREAVHITAPSSFGGEDVPAPSAILHNALPASAKVRLTGQPGIPPPIRFADRWSRDSTGDEIRGRLRGLSPVGSLWNLPAPEAAPVAIDRFPLSQSSLSAFGRCSRRFFYTKVLRVREEPEAAMQMGTMFHKIMAKIGRRFPSKGALHDAVSSEGARGLIDDVIRHEVGLGEGAYFLRSVRHHLERMVAALLTLESGESDDYTIVDVEIPLSFSFEGWDFTGRIDRLDRMPDGTLALLDYKAARLGRMATTLRKKILTAGQHPDTANWQVPLYIKAYQVTQGVTPQVFKHHALRPGDEAFSVSLFIRDSEKSVTVEEASTKRKHQGISYLLCEEIEHIMGDAVALAELIFAERSGFEKTENRQHCHSCMFRLLCGREER
jgi:hypothetical protein